ncbi:MAG: chorismate synthase [Candidatus Bipolaricaulia bacterium]
MRFLTGGESHGPCLMTIVEGLPAGLEIDVRAIDDELARRQAGYGRGERMKIERDRAEILGGVLAGRTIGAPIVLQIANRDWENWREKWESGSLPRVTVPRPGHADWAGMQKYGLADARPILERASARETAARVAVGALAKLLLREFGISVGSTICSIGSVEATIPDGPWNAIWARAEKSSVRCADEAAGVRMIEAIDSARAAGESLGGLFCVAATGVPAGLGSHVHWDRRLDAQLACAVMSIQAVKGVEIGSGFAGAGRTGTQAHDSLTTDERGNVIRVTNRAGGVEGGMSNGEAIVLRAAMKPIPTTVTPQESIDTATGAPAKTEYQRSDVCAVPAAAVVGEAMVAWVLAVALREKLGGDSLEEMKAHDDAWGSDG